MTCADYHTKGKDYLVYKKNYEEALFYFRRVHDMCPNDTDIGNVYADEGYALYKLGRMEESLNAYDMALQISQQKLASDPKRREYITNNEIARFNRQMLPTKHRGHPSQLGKMNILVPLTERQLHNKLPMNNRHLQQQACPFRGCYPSAAFFWPLSSFR